MARKSFGDRKSPEPMLDVEQEPLVHFFHPEQYFFLMAGRAKQPCFTGERDRQALMAAGAFVSSDSFSGIAAQKKTVCGVGDDFAKGAVFFEVEAVVVGLKGVKMAIDNLKKGVLLKAAGCVTGGHQ